MTTQHKTIELLSPAGSFDALRAAVENGANAVYLGGNRFNARRFAGNFDGEQIRQAFDYAHLRGVAVHVTLNTMLFDRELKDALAYAKDLYRHGADAFILQDVGLATLLRNALPDACLHASTQMGIHSPAGVAFAQKLGFDRAVLSREVSLQQLKRITRESSIGIEVFAHGAMCVSFSGGCLLSSMAGERSGNRGTCAQPCRKKYSFGEKTGYLLSMADLSMADRVQELIKAGAISLKIEGRMKRPEYVALVTKAYRLAIDGADQHTIETELASLKKVFDRGQYHYGYYDGQGTVRTLAVHKEHENSAVLSAAQKTYETSKRKTPLSLRFTVQQGEPCSLTLTALGKTVQVTGEVPQQAQKPQDPERIQEQLKKLNDTPFMAEDITLACDPMAFLSVSAINGLRRSGVEALTKAILAERDVPASTPSAPAVPAQKPLLKTPVITARVRTIEQAKAAFSSEAEEVAVVPYRVEEDFIKDCFKLKEAHPKKKLLFSLPAVVLDQKDEEQYKNALQKYEWDGAIAHSPGQIDFIRHLSKKVGASSFNIANHESLKAYQNIGFDELILSEELTKPQLRDIVCHGGAGVTVYGRTAVMQLLHCPKKQATGCENCKGDVGILYDEEKRPFVMGNTRFEKHCLVTLYNAFPTDIIGLAGELKGVAAWHLNFTEETPEQVTSILRTAAKARAGETTDPLPDTTRGHWNRAVD